MPTPNYFDLIHLRQNFIQPPTPPTVEGPSGSFGLYTPGFEAAISADGESAWYVASNAADIDDPDNDMLLYRYGLEDGPQTNPFSILSSDWDGAKFGGVYIARELVDGNCPPMGGGRRVLGFVTWLHVIP